MMVGTSGVNTGGEKRVLRKASTGRMVRYRKGRFGTITSITNIKKRKSVRRWSAAIGVGVLAPGLWLSRELFVSERPPTSAASPQQQRLTGPALAIDGDTLEVAG